jgi:hypothetical protein
MGPVRGPHGLSLTIWMAWRLPGGAAGGIEGSRSLGEGHLITGGATGADRGGSRCAIDTLEGLRGADSARRAHRVEGRCEGTASRGCEGLPVSQQRAGRQAAGGIPPSIDQLAVWRGSERNASRRWTPLHPAPHWLQHAGEGEEGRDNRDPAPHRSRDTYGYRRGTSGTSIRDAQPCSPEFKQDSPSARPKSVNWKNDCFLGCPGIFKDTFLAIPRIGEDRTPIGIRV